MRGRCICQGDSAFFGKISGWATPVQRKDIPNGSFHTYPDLLNVLDIESIERQNNPEVDPANVGHCMIFLGLQITIAGALQLGYIRSSTAEGNTGAVVSCRGLR
jgi:hypothetical protein